MKFLDKIKDLFTDEEEVIETKEIETEESEEHKLPTFMRNKIEEEEKREEKQRENINKEAMSDSEIVKSRSENNFSFPIEMDDEPEIFDLKRRTSQNILVKERERPNIEPYSKREEPKPKKFRPTPVISPVYGILDKNYTKDEVKVQDENSYEIQRPSRKVDFETVRNKAFGNLTDDIKNNLCENCELYQEVKITKNADQKEKKDDLKDNLLSDMTEDDVSLGTAEENYFDFGVSYEPPKIDTTVINNNEVEINNDIKIINHNDEESTAEKIEVKEESKDINLEDTKEFEKVEKVSEEISDIKNIDDEIINKDIDNDIFNLIDSVYDDEEDK
ncbi:MAG: hypothetical protein ACI31S_01285 [Bacilli bacterium]